MYFPMLRQLQFVDELACMSTDFKGACFLFRTLPIWVPWQVVALIQSQERPFTEILCLVSW
jgi:hypothetical protein